MGRAERMTRNVRLSIVVSALLSLSAWTGATAQSRPPGTWTAPYPPTVDDDDQPATDALIKTRLLAAYALDSNVAMLDLDVGVDRGVVILSGTVASVAERELAIEIARGIGPVRAVKSSIRVEAAPQHEAGVPAPNHGLRLNAATTTAVQQRLLDSPGIGAAADIHVCANAGTVTLAGTVASAAARALAGRIAANTDGVHDVRNDLRIQVPPPGPRR